MSTKNFKPLMVSFDEDSYNKAQEKTTEKPNERPCMQKWSDGGLGANSRALGGFRRTSGTIRRRLAKFPLDLVLQDIRISIF